MRCPLVDADVAALGSALAATHADIVVNCIGVLQDAPGSPAADANLAFVSRLIDALASGGKDASLLVHVSIPGEAAEDATEFSRGKRAAEAVIAASGLSYVILRPGFVLAEAAFGGSALMRALAVLPVDLPREIEHRPFAVTAAADLGRTVAFLAAEWQVGRRDRRATWDVMETEASSVGAVLAGLARRLGGPA